MFIPIWPTLCSHVDSNVYLSLVKWNISVIFLFMSRNQLKIQFLTPAPPKILCNQQCPVLNFSAFEFLYFFHLWLLPWGFLSFLKSAYYFRLSKGESQCFCQLVIFVEHKQIKANLLALLFWSLNPTLVVGQLLVVWALEKGRIVVA